MNSNWRKIGSDERKQPTTIHVATIKHFLVCKTILQNVNYKIKTKLQNK